MSRAVGKETVRNEEECCEINGRLNLPASIEHELERGGGLASLIDGLPDESALKDAAEMHQALSDPIRLKIMHALVRCDLCPCLMKEITSLSDSKLSYHLNVLEEAKLIESIPQKKWRIYSITELGKRELDTVQLDTVH